MQQNSLARADHASPSPRPRVSGVPGANNKTRVLVVEDEKDISGLIKHTLERSGDAIVDIAASGDQALKLASEQQVDLIILVQRGDSSNVFAFGKRNPLSINDFCTDVEWWRAGERQVF